MCATRGVREWGDASLRRRWFLLDRNDIGQQHFGAQGAEHKVRHHLVPDMKPSLEIFRKCFRIILRHQVAQRWRVFRTDFRVIVERMAIGTLRFRDHAPVGNRLGICLDGIEWDNAISCVVAGASSQGQDQGNERRFGSSYRVLLNGATHVSACIAARVWRLTETRLTNDT
jgi:hypothetical protein